MKEEKAKSRRLDKEKRRRLNKGEEERKRNKKKEKKGLARIGKQFRVSTNTFKLLIGLPFPFKIAISF